MKSRNATLQPDFLRHRGLKPEPMLLSGGLGKKLEVYFLVTMGREYYMPEARDTAKDQRTPRTVLHNKELAVPKCQ